MEGDTIVAGPWPVHFLPAFNTLTHEAVDQAETVDLEGRPIRVVRPDHLAVLALSVGRAKDFLRLLALLEAGSVVPAAVQRLAEKHGLSEQWQRFTERYLDA